MKTTKIVGVIALLLGFTFIYQCIFTDHEPQYIGKVFGALIGSILCIYGFITLRYKDENN